MSKGAVMGRLKLYPPEASEGLVATGSLFPTTYMATSTPLRARHAISVSNTLIYLDELYSSILRGTSRDEYLFLQSVFLTPWLLADRSWCRVRPAPLNQSEWWSLKSNCQSP